MTNFTDKERELMSNSNSNSKGNKASNKQNTRPASDTPGINQPTNGSIPLGAPGSAAQLESLVVRRQ